MLALKNGRLEAKKLASHFNMDFSAAGVAQGCFLVKFTPGKAGAFSKKTD
jgi:hypothetical protein